MQQATPEDPQERPNKRRRKILACHDCRRRKVQCDRKIPICTRCEKSGRASFCNYDEETHGNSDTVEDAPDAGRRLSPSALMHTPGSASTNVSVSREVWDDLVARLLDQERKLAKYQSRDRHQSSLNFSPATKSQNDIPIGSAYPLPESLMFRRKGFKAQLWGTTDTRKLFLPGVDLFAFTRNLFGKNAALGHQTKELKAIDGIRKSTRSSRLPPPSDIKLLLPPRREAEHLISIFIDRIDSVYCVLHIPSFLEENNRFWNDVQGHNPAFAALLLAIMATVRSHDVDQNRKYVSMSSCTRDIARDWIDAVDEWLWRQSWKHTSLIRFQIRSILLVAKQMNRHKFKRRWVDTGDFINELITRGFHRSPNLIMDRTSVFEKEMRRRIWALAVELDLDASLDFGMPCRSSIASCDAEYPLNVNDADLTPGMTNHLRSRPRPELTKATYLHLAPQSRDLRRRLTCILNEPTTDMTFTEAMTYTSDLESYISTIHQWRNADTDSRNNTPQALNAGLTVLELQLQQYLVIIHGLILRRTDLSPSSTSFSILTFATAAKSILRLHTDLIQSGNNAILLYREDALRIASWAAPVSVRSQSQPFSSPPIAQWLDMASTALHLIDYKSRQLGTLEPPIAFSFANYDFIRHGGKVPPNVSATEGAFLGTDMLFALGRHILDNQEEGFMQIVAARKGERGAAGADPAVAPGNIMQPVVGAAVNGHGNAADFSDVALADFSAWDIDSWMFDPMAFGGLQPVLGDEYN